jgi:pyruvyl transferase EpsO
MKNSSERMTGRQAHHPDEALIESLRQRLVESLRPLVEGRRVALLDFPAHDNVGDSAIWTGELAALRLAGCSDIVYTADQRNLDVVAVRKAIGQNGVVCLHGGGNLGTLWPHHQAHRELVLQAFSDVRIVQLPQSVYFEDEVSFEHFAKIARTCRDLTVMVRDRASLLRCKGLGGVRTVLAPDSAFALGSIRPPRPTEVLRFALVREDKEAEEGSAKRLAAQADRSADWLVHEMPRWQRARRRALVWGARRVTSPWLRARLMRYLAEDRVQYGLEMLAQGEQVLTDRLHAHILCVLMGRRHTVLDNSYGKLSSFIDCWTKDAVSIARPQ